ncbi:hypothetical protein [Methylocystis parvus]|uniref:hypothetical protein n=1 Tax=Methylocystis parvus TaxID=134 RepID=UPI003C76BBFB
MRPLESQLASSKESSAATAIPPELQIAIRLSFEAVTEEPLPREMALLLLRLALAELMRSAGGRETFQSAHRECELEPEWG